MDIRFKQLAKNLVNYSCKVKPGERVLINAVGTSTFPLVRQLIKEVYAAGGNPYVDLQDSTITRELMLGCNKEQMEFFNEYDLLRIKGMEIGRAHV